MTKANQITTPSTVPSEFTVMKTMIGEAVTITVLDIINDVMDERFSQFA